jgi:hypothetical protein
MEARQRPILAVLTTTAITRSRRWEGEVKVKTIRVKRKFWSRMTTEQLHAELVAALCYDGSVGSFTLRSAGNKIPFLVGRDGRMSAYVVGKHWQIGRLVWFYVTGTIPKLEVDHVNRNFLDNRIENLRLATRSQNAANRPAASNSKTGVKGVYPERNKWRAEVQVGGKKIVLGVFPTIAEASAAYRNAAIKYHGEFACIE